MTGSGRLADDGLPHSGGRSRSTRGRTSRPSRGTASRASGTCCAPSPQPGASAARTSSGRPRGSTTRSGDAQLRASTEPLTSSLLSEAARGIAATFEPAFGGFGRAPKFPAASTLELLLRRGDDDSLAMVEKTLDGMAAGGMYDVVGGGFHRYSVDDRWLVPHFEKMLYDNARPRLDVSARVGRHREGALPRGRRGDARLPPPRAAAAGGRSRLRAGRGHRRRRGADPHVDAGGSRRSRDPARAARAVRARPLRRPRRARSGAPRPRARGARERPQPFRDDKALASWNGLALAALAEAGYRLERDDWLEAARRIAEFLLGPLSDEDGRLLRSRRDGRASGSGFLDDYANVAYGLLELHVATGELRWLHEARRLALLAIELFADEERGGFFLSPADGDARVAAHEGPPGHAHPVGQLDARLGAPARSRGSGATTSSSGTRSRSSGSSSPRCGVRRAPSRGCSAASTSG